MILFLNNGRFVRCLVRVVGIMWRTSSKCSVYFPKTRIKSIGPYFQEGCSGVRNGYLWTVKYVKNGTPRLILGHTSHFPFLLPPFSIQFANTTSSLKNREFLTEPANKIVSAIDKRIYRRVSVYLTPPILNRSCFRSANRARKMLVNTSRDNQSHRERDVTWWRARKIAMQIVATPIRFL
jgi:hypothetical protein